MPYRLERHNFNPHKVLGNFDFDAKTRRPIFLKNKFNQLTDKNFRIVNQYPYFSDWFQNNINILTKSNKIKFVKCYWKYAEIY